ncbi:MAG: hypothetical protein RIC87_04895 [Kiloniellales bacterium]
MSARTEALSLALCQQSRAEVGNNRELASISARRAKKARNA